MIDGTSETSIRPACAARRVSCLLAAAAVAALALSGTVAAKPTHRANATDAKQHEAKPHADNAKKSAKADKKKDK